MKSWIRYSLPRNRPQTRLFCLPFAGGYAAAFCRWPRLLPDEIEVCPVQFPGHGDRMLEQIFDNLDGLVDAAVDGLAGELDKLPYAIFGYSMGALVAFELTRALRRKGLRQPDRLFLAARRAPDLDTERQAIHGLADADFLDEIRRFEGTPIGFFSEPALVRLALPALRADFKLCETYVYEREAPLEIPITAFAGADDSAAPPESAIPWREQTTCGFEMIICPGGHFFLMESEADLLIHIERRLLGKAGSDNPHLNTQQDAFHETRARG